MSQGRSGNTISPCESFTSNSFIQTVQAGSRLKVGWWSGNLCGGFVKLSLAPFKQPQMQQDFDNNLLKITCFGSNSGRCSASGCAHPCGARGGCEFYNSISDNERYDTTITVPYNLKGSYTLQMVAYIGTSSSPIYSCSRLEILGGSTDLSCPQTDISLPNLNCIQTPTTFYNITNIFQNTLGGPFCFSPTGSGSIDDAISETPVNVDCDPRGGCKGYAVPLKVPICNNTIGIDILSPFVSPHDVCAAATPTAPSIPTTTLDTTTVTPFSSAETTTDGLTSSSTLDVIWTTHSPTTSTSVETSVTDLTSSVVDPPPTTTKVEISSTTFTLSSSTITKPFESTKVVSSTERVFSTTVSESPSSETTIASSKTSSTNTLENPTSTGISSTVIAPTRTTTVANSHSSSDSYLTTTSIETTDYSSLSFVSFTGASSMLTTLSKTTSFSTIRIVEYTSSQTTTQTDSAGIPTRTFEVSLSTMASSSKVPPITAGTSFVPAVSSTRNSISETTLRSSQGAATISKSTSISRATSTAKSVNFLGTVGDNLPTPMPATDQYTPPTPSSIIGACGPQYGSCASGYCCSQYNYCGKY
ncbi:hypothetical protein HDV04_001254 [Boothiomyces sp. JEL0838]|nr:hypothetical protein HDV04_001254 [Boothiomyces sp. JEL0838]